MKNKKKQNKNLYKEKNIILIKAQTNGILNIIGQNIYRETLKGEQMYPDSGGDVGAGLSDLGEAPRNIFKNLEGVVPFILILIIAIFIGYKMDLWDLPILGTEDKLNILVIGAPEPSLLTVLNENRDMLVFQQVTPSILEVAPTEQLAQYDIVILDQHAYPYADKYARSLSRQAGEAIEKYVNNGGKLIVIMDSGIYKSGGTTGTGVAKDVVGWKGILGDAVPVTCGKTVNGLPSCTQPITVIGRIYRVSYNHPIMSGIEMAPATLQDAPYTMITFDVAASNGETLAYIKADATSDTKGLGGGATYPAIVEKKSLLGKSIYFNYNPGLTPTIFAKTLQYLK